jgi:hypothetical protein
LTSSAPSGSSSSSAVGRVDQRPGQRDPLLLAARELPRLPVLVPLELDDAEHLLDATLVLAARHALYLQPERDVVVDRHVREERVLLEHHVDRAAVREDRRHVVALEQDAPLVGDLEAGDHPQRRRLAAAARAEQREELAFADRERDVAPPPRACRSACSQPSSAIPATLPLFPSA